MERGGRRKVHAPSCWRGLLCPCPRRWLCGLQVTPRLAELLQAGLGNLPRAAAPLWRANGLRDASAILRVTSAEEQEGEMEVVMVGSAQERFHCILRSSRLTEPSGWCGRGGCSCFKNLPLNRVFYS